MQEYQSFLLLWEKEGGFGQPCCEDNYKWASSRGDVYFRFIDQMVGFPVPLKCQVENLILCQFFIIRKYVIQVCG